MNLPILIRPLVVPFAFAVVGVIGFGTGSARADSLFFGSISTTFTVSEILNSAGDSVDLPDGLSIDGFGFTFSEGEITEGNASAMADSVFSSTDFFDMGIGDSIGVTSLATGSTGYDGFAEAFALNDLFIDITNGTQADYTVRFQVDFSFLVSASIFGPGFDNASAFTRLVLDAPGFGFEETWFADALFGPGELSGSDTFFIDVTVLAGNVDFVIAIVDAEGSGVSVIPEPSSLVMAGLGAAGLFGMIGAGRRRRRRELEGPTA